MLLVPGRLPGNTRGAWNDSCSCFTMKALKNTIPLAVIIVLAFSQFTGPQRAVSSQDATAAKNDSIFQVLNEKISDLEDEISTLNRKLYGFSGSISLFPTSIRDLEGQIDDLESDIRDIKGSFSFGSTSLRTLESEIDDLKRSSHSHD